MSFVEPRIIGSTLLFLLCTAWTSAATPPQYTLLGEQHASASLHTGYRVINPDGTAAMANPYGVNRSGLTGGFALALLQHDLKVRADGQFLHPDDYQSELIFDHSGILKIELEGRSLHHNLVRHETIPNFTGAVIPPVTYNSLPSGNPADLGITSRQERADLRVRFGNFPGHLSLGYWRFGQTGHDQLTVADFDSANSVVTFYDLTRRIEQQTHQGQIGLDANLGPVSMAYNFRIRDFSTSAPAINVPFTAAVPAESRVTAHTVKLYSNLSGGLTAAAAYSITQRENTTDRSDLNRSARPRDTIQQVAGDLSYTPLKQLTVALRYRHQALDRETPATVTTALSGTTTVRPATGSVRDTISLTSTWRPDRQLTLRSEYRAEFIARENVWQPLTASTTQAVSDDSNQLHSGTLSLLWHPWNSIRLHTSYRYTTNNHPGTLYDFDRRHNGNLLLDWSSTGRWGTNLHYRATADQNDRTRSTAWPPQTGSLVTPRDSLHQSAGASIWFSPLAKLVLTASYGCMAIDAQQVLLLTPTATSSLTTNYSSLGHVYSLDGVYAAGDGLDLSASLQQVRSRASFQLPSSAPDIGSYNRLNTSESSALARIDWRFAKHMGGMLEYRFSAYRSDERQYNGDIHSTTVSLTARW